VLTIATLALRYMGDDLRGGSNQDASATSIGKSMVALPWFSDITQIERAHRQLRHLLVGKDASSSDRLCIFRLMLHLLKRPSART
jgi:hypothetical protein